MSACAWRLIRAGMTLALGVVLFTSCDQHQALSIGAKAPEIRTKTLADVGGDLSQLTSYRYPDERMYRYSVDEAMKQGKTIVLEFATPGHCTVCDKQLQMLKGALVKYEQDVIFMHMDQYQNPGAFTAFKVKGDPWTFIIDAKGVVRFQRPGSILYNELDRAISSVLSRAVG